jgi:quercetin dioxygenase-like cupin family protein
MTTRVEGATGGRVLGPEDGDIGGGMGGLTNRFILSAAETDGGFALVEHRLAPRALAGPLHRHDAEDEYSFVLEGQVGALLGDEEFTAQVGDFICKPRGQWHTFWNASDIPARVLEIIAPAGLEELFRSFGALVGQPEPAAMAEMAARYGCQLDFDRTFPIVQRHGLAF